MCNSPRNILFATVANPILLTYWLGAYKRVMSSESRTVRQPWNWHSTEKDTQLAVPHWHTAQWETPLKKLTFKSKLSLKAHDMILLSFSLMTLWSTVRLRFRKSISIHHFQSTNNLIIMISNTIQMLLIVFRKTFLQKKCFFSSCNFFTLFNGPFQLPNYCPL